MEGASVAACKARCRATGSTGAKRGRSRYFVFDGDALEFSRSCRPFAQLHATTGLRGMWVGAGLVGHPRPCCSRWREERAMCQTTGREQARHGTLVEGGGQLADGRRPHAPSQDEGAVTQAAAPGAGGAPAPHASPASAAWPTHKQRTKLNMFFPMRSKTKKRGREESSNDHDGSVCTPPTSIYRHERLPGGTGGSPQAPSGGCGAPPASPSRSGRSGGSPRPRPTGR